MPIVPEIHSTRPRLIFDTTVLSNFAAVGQVALLEKLYSGQAFTALPVADEIRRGLDAGYAYLSAVEAAFAGLSQSGWLPVLPMISAREQSLYVELSQSLAPGEASCLSLAIVQELTLASDDLAARREATQRGVSLTGTVGILVRAVRQQQMTLAAGNEMLARMIALRYRAPVQLLDDLI